ncbi:MAG: alkaline phosphatase D family protein, partial [Thermoleophilaceae bacterium]
DRRELLGYAGIGTGALILGGVVVDPSAAARARRRPRFPLAQGGTFPQGVGSGAPNENAITLWTRLEGPKRDRRVVVEVATDPDFRRVVDRRNVLVSPARDNTVEIRLRSRKLKPGNQYFYRFETKAGSSPVGKFRTLRPADSREPVRVAFFSCQDYQAGFYNAHRAIAAEDADLVISLGDYIYERTFYEGPRKDTLGANGDGEVQTLPEYRQKYQLYKSDPDLRAMHAASPFIGTWDDHEVEDNYAAGRPGDAAENPRVPFETRRQAAYQAFYEYMPFMPATVDPAGKGFDLYRKLPLGANADLFMLDERKFRDDQPCNDEFFVPCPEAESEPRDFLGRTQMQFLQRGLRNSGATWKLIGNQLMIMSLELSPGAQITKDSWDGYGVERRELMNFIASSGISNVSFLTGDIHTFFAGDVGIDGRGPESHATEFVGGSITSLGVPETVQGSTGAPLTREQIVLLSNNLRTTNPHLQYTEQLSRGYGVLEARPDELRVEFKGVDAMTRGAEARTIGRFSVANGNPRVRVL